MIFNIVGEFGISSHFHVLKLCLAAPLSNTESGSSFPFSSSKFFFLTKEAKELHNIR